MFTNYPWPEFFILWGLGLVGAVLVLPYLLEVNRPQFEKAKMPLPALLALSTLQNAVLLGLTAGIGLLVSRAAGLETPLISAWVQGRPLPEEALSRLPLSAALGALGGAVLVALETWVFLARLPETLLRLARKANPLKGFLASFYGGFSEEILMRLFLFSGLAWLLGRFWQTSSGMPASGAFWTANLLVAVLFGLGHLPATAAITPLTPLIVFRAIVLNGIVGLLFGYLFWRFGLEAAILAHFSTDIVLHVLGPLAFRPRLAQA